MAHRNRWAQEQGGLKQWKRVAQQSLVAKQAPLAAVTFFHSFSAFWFEMCFLFLVYTLGDDKWGSRALIDTAAALLTWQLFAC